MSGIVVNYNARLDGRESNFDDVLKKFHFGDLIAKVRFKGNKLDAALLSSVTSEGSSTYDRDLKIFIIVDGYFVENLGRPQSSAEWFLCNYKERGDLLFNDLNGSYNILIINEDTNCFKLVNDRYGTRPLFYAASGEFAAVSPFANQIIELGTVKKALNESMVANQLSYSRVWLRNETFFKGIFSLPASSCLEWSHAGGSRVREVNAKIQSTNSCQMNEDELAENFRSVMSDFSRVRGVGLSLSGGLDSRILLASGFKGPTFTWGYQENNDEITLAKRTSEITGNNWNFIKLSPEDFLDESCNGDRFREGLDIFVQSYALKSYPKVKQHGITSLMTGLALDFTMAGTYDIDCRPDELNGQLTFEFLCSKSEYFTSDQQARLINSGTIRSEINDLTAFIRDEIDAETALSCSKSIKRFFFNNRVRRCIFQRQQWQRAFVEDYIPTFDNRIYDGLESFSSDKLKDHGVFVKVLKILSPKLMSIPYQGTMVPVNVPRKFWKHSMRLESEKEQMYRDIYAESNGKIFIPYNRYYSNFDEWLRVNPHWIDYCKNILLSEETVLSNYCDIGVVREWVEAQRSGKKAYFSKIIQLMSLEKTLRSHFV